jgi:PAS domain S-box-containing protein
MSETSLITTGKTPKHVRAFSDIRFKQALENAPIGVALLSLRGKYLRVNQAFCDIVGYTKEELLTIGWKNITYKDDIQTNEELFDDLVSNKIKTFQLVKRFVHKYGQPVWAQINVSLVRNESGKPLFAINHVQDISGRKKMEDMLLESEERYRYIQKATDDVVWDWDLVKDRMHVSENFLTTFKYDPKYIEKQPFKSWWLARLHPEDKDRVLTTWESVITKNHDTHFSVEYRMLKGDGQYAYLLSQGYVFYDENNNAVRLLGVKIDITKQKESELVLRQSEERYGLVVNNVTDLISIIDSDANYLFCSPSHKQIMGFEPEELIGINALSFIHPDDMPSVIEELHKILKGEARNALFRVRHKNGRYVTLEGKGKAILDVYNKPYVLVLTSHDISERIAFEQKKDSFIKMASHELRTPLTTLKAYTQVLEKECRNNKKQGHYLKKMDEQIERLVFLVQDLSDVSKLEKGKMELHPERFSLNALLNDIVEDMRLTTDKHKIIVKAYTPIEIFADRYRISQVLINLISNAIKYSPNTTKIIVSANESFGLVLLKVQDFGVGISKEDQKQIFDAFYQNKKVNIYSRMGLGLGLYITSRIIKGHKGTIEVSSEIGKGSTFIVHLPALQKSIEMQSQDQTPVSSLVNI